MYPSELLNIANIVNEMYGDYIVIKVVYPVPFTSLIRIELSSYEYLTYDRKTGKIIEEKA